MADITAAMVKELRERTGAGMMECKAALVETKGDLDEAHIYLRKKMGNKLSGREGRSAGEGVIAVYVNEGKFGSIVELNAETDFVARNDDFRALALELAQHVANSSANTVEEALSEPSHTDSSLTLNDRVHDVFARLRENIVFKRFERIAAPGTGLVAGYVHTAANDRIGVLVELVTGSEEDAGSEASHKLGKEIAMQVAGAKPHYLTRDEVPKEIVEEETDIAKDKAQNLGRTGVALEKTIEGDVRKFYERVVLLDQPYLRDPKQSISKLVKSAGTGYAIKKFIRFEVGE